MNPALVQGRVSAFWNSSPCDSDLSDRDRNSREYYLDIERARYSLQAHIPEIIARIDWRGKRVLEIGAGVGTDARRLIAAGAIYTGINVDRASTAEAARALQIFALPGTVLQCDATSLDFADNSFDIVYSFGVLHHIPEVEKAVAEIHRVLKPGGLVLAMLYNRSSINYRIEIMFLRRLGLRLLDLPGAIAVLDWLGLPREKLERHKALHERYGKSSTGHWLGRNTNGPDNPYAQVYDAKRVRTLFKAFRIESEEICFFDHRHWGVLGRLLPRSLRLALGRRWGWHRIVCAAKHARGRCAR